MKISLFWLFFLISKIGIQFFDHPSQDVKIPHNLKYIGWNSWISAADSRRGAKVNLENKFFSRLLFNQRPGSRRFFLEIFPLVLKSQVEAFSKIFQFVRNLLHLLSHREHSARKYSRNARSTLWNKFCLRELPDLSIYWARDAIFAKFRHSTGSIRERSECPWKKAW